MSYFAVRYDYTGDPARRDQVRPDHRAFLSSLHEQDVVVASGPLTESDPSAALLIVRADSPDHVLKALADDPFNSEGFIAKVTIEPWNPVIGILAS